MMGRLAMTAAAVVTVIAVEELMQKSQPLYVLVMSGMLSFGRLLLLWLNLLPLIFYHSTAEITSIAIAYRYYTWSENHEIVALKNAGLSCLRIARPAIFIIVLFSLFCALNSLFLLGPSWTTVESIQYAAVSSVNPVILEPGEQQAVAAGLSIEFSHRLSDGTLTDIVIFDARESPKFRILWAKTGQFVDLGEQDVLWLNDGAYYVHDERGLTTDFKSMSLPVEAGHVAAPTPLAPGLYEQSVWGLLHPPQWIRDDHKRYAIWLFEGHHRIISPLLCLGNGLLVLGLLVPGAQNRLRRVWRLLIAFANAMATTIVMAPASAIAVHHLWVLPYLYVLPAIPAVIGTLLLVAGDKPSAGLRSRWSRHWLVGVRTDQALVEEPL